MEVSELDPRNAADVDEAVLAARLSAMSHPARLAILRGLSERCCCCSEVVGQFDLAQSTVSQHLKVLVGAGLVRLKPDRQRSIYHIDRDAVAATASALARFASDCCVDGEGLRGEQK